MAVDPPKIHYTDSKRRQHRVLHGRRNGPIDLLSIPGFVSHLEVFWEAPEVESYFGRQ